MVNISIPIAVYYGNTCMFYDLGHIGIKWYVDERVRNECMKRQLKWSKVGYAPLVFGKVDDGGPRGYRYGYYTELVTPMVNGTFDRNGRFTKITKIAKSKKFSRIVDEIALIQQKHKLYDVVSDLTPCNVGDRYGQYVPIDFD